MNKTIGILAATVIAGTSMSALASPTNQSFADSFAQLQALSSNSSQWQQATPTFSRQAADPTRGLSIANYQSLSSESAEWQPSQRRYTVDRGPSFARTNPSGLPFADYQALSSNSGEYAAPETGSTSSMAAAPSRTTTASPNWPTLRERLASFFHRNAAPASDMN